MLRSLGAVLLGYLTFMVLLTTFAVLLALAIYGKLPEGSDERNMPLTIQICVAYIVVGWVLAVLSGYVTAWVARRKELTHAIVLAAFMFNLGVLYFVERVRDPERPEPLWYLLANLLLPIVSVPLGGMLRARHVRARGLDLDDGKGK